MKTAGMQQLLICWALAATAVALPARADHVASLAPIRDRLVVVSNKTATIRNLELTGMSRFGGMSLQFQVLYRAPDQFSVVLSRDATEPSYLVADSRSVMYYDPGNRAITVLRAARVKVHLFTKGPLSLLLEVSDLRGFDTDSVIEIDLPALLSALEMSPQHSVRARLDGQQDVVFVSEKKNRATLTIDRLAPFPVTNILFASIDQIFLEMKLRVNADSPSDFPSLRDMARLRAAFPVVEHDFGALKAIQAAVLSIRSLLVPCLFGGSTDDASCRGVDAMIPESVDWRMLGNNYTQDRTKLVDILPALR